MRVSEAILWVDAILLSAAIGWALVVAYIPLPNYVLLRRLFWAIAIGIGIFVFVWDMTATQSAWVRVPFVALASAAIGVCAVEGTRWTYREATSHQSPDKPAVGPQPDIVVVQPLMNYILVWDPPKQPFIFSSPLKIRKSKVPHQLEIGDIPLGPTGESTPPFRVKNLGSAVAHNVRMHWEQTMDEQQLRAEINKSEMFNKYPSSDRNNITYEDSTFQLPYLAPVIDNTSYEDVPIPYFIYLYAEIYFAAVISGDPLKEWVKVPFRLTISWEHPPGGKPTTFVVTATARNLNPSLSSPPSLRPLISSAPAVERIEVLPLPKIMAEITFGVERIAP